MEEEAFFLACQEGLRALHQRSPLRLELTAMQAWVLLIA
jgi:hypothetical protein